MSSSAAASSSSSSAPARTSLRRAEAEAAGRPKATTFHPRPQYFIVKRHSEMSDENTLELDAEAAAHGLTADQLTQIKEENQKRIKRVVGAVAIVLTIISVVLVGLSLSFGSKIDELVGKNLKGSAGDLHSSANGFYLGTPTPPP